MPATGRAAGVEQKGPPHGCGVKRPPAQVRGLNAVILYIFDSRGEFFFAKTETLVVTFGPNTALSAILPKSTRCQALIPANQFLYGL